MNLSQLEVDFVVNRPPYKFYIQSAFHMPTPEKEQQERRPLLSINDHFRKIVIVGDDILFLLKRKNLANARFLSVEVIK